MYIVVFITASNQKEASNIAKALLENKLVACVNILDKVKSIFWWQGKIDQAQEALLIVKSKKSELNKIIKLVKSIHSYQVPEIIASPIIGGNQSYLRWLNESIRKPS